jgi:hypothetical protein
VHDVGQVLLDELGEVGLAQQLSAVAGPVAPVLGGGELEDCAVVAPAGNAITEAGFSRVGVDDGGDAVGGDVGPQLGLGQPVLGEVVDQSAGGGEGDSAALAVGAESTGLDLVAQVDFPV